MLNLHVVQADYGDCLVLEYGSPADRRFLLIDGGPAGVYEKHLRPVLEQIAAAGGSLAAILLSHVDEDHVLGLLDLLTDQQWRRSRGLAETIAISELWHNTYSQTLGVEISDRFDRLMRNAGPLRAAMAATDRTSRSIAQGDQLTQAAEALHIRINERFPPAGLIALETVPDGVNLDNLRLHVIGPTQKNLFRLKKEWLAWLKTQERRLGVPDSPRALRAAPGADDSIPNRSSIMLLAEADGKSLLLTGDGRHDHLLQGLKQARLLDSHGCLHVDILKLPHHGSNRNVNRAFFEKVTANRYVISANDTKHDNPDADTLCWLVETGREQGRHVDILATNATARLRAFVAEYDPAEWGYDISIMPEDEHIRVLRLAP